jgi:hypothetical protein
VVSRTLLNGRSTPTSSSSTRRSLPSSTTPSTRSSCCDAKNYDTNAGNELDAVTTLIAQARSRLPDLVADARDQANTWGDIADQLGVSTLRATARYSRYARRRRTPIEPD